MRFIEIFEQLQEGIPMGQKALTSPKSMNYTIGFEFEVAVQPDAPSYSSDYDDDDYDEFTQWYYNTGQFDREDWVNDYFKYTKDVIDFVKENYIEPKYGAISFDEFQKITDAEMKSLFGNDYDRVLDLIEKDEQIRSLEYFEGKSKEELLQDALELVYLDTKYLKKREKTPEEITDAFNMVYDEDTTKLKNTLRGTYSRIEQFVNELTDEEDYADAPRIYSNNEKTDYIDPEELTDLEDLLKYYDISKEDVFELLEDDINEAESEDMESTYDSWLQGRGGQSSESLSYVRYQLDEIGYNWSVVPDETRGVDAEIVTPVFSLDEGLKVLEEIFNFIKDDEYIYTTEACGLHVNIGTWKGDEVNRIDLFKFLTILNAQGILKDYGRVFNQFAKDKYQNIAQDFVSPRGIDNVKAYNTFVASVNKDILQRAEKMQSVNLQKLKNLGYIELRAMGNEDYETKFDQTKFHILKFIRSLDIAQNPNAYRNEYLKKVSKLFLKDTMKPDPLETFVKNTLNLRSRFGYVIDELLVLEPNVLSTHYNKEVYKALAEKVSDSYWGKTFADEIKREVDKLSDEEKEQLTKSLFGRHMLKIANTGKL